jgi:hypothetical protein
LIPKSWFESIRQKEAMAAHGVGTSSGTGLHSRIDRIVSELKGYIETDLITMEEIIFLLQKDPKLRPTKTTEDDEQPSVTEVNVSLCSLRENLFEV